MAIFQKKYDYKLTHILRDTRPLGTRIYDFLSNSDYAATLYFLAIVFVLLPGPGQYFADLILLLGLLYWWFLIACNRTLCYKMPAWSPYKDKNERDGKPRGIMFMGNSQQYENEEIWFNNADVRTHILYLGTTGAGKTEGLKSIVSNALMWGSGFIYIDGKADTDLWASLCAMVRRFGRDDDLLVLNYMTGNSDDPAPSNTLNPFSSGSASYLTQMLVSLMPEAGGDNAMWKERAISLLSSLMPALTWKRDHQDLPLNINTIRHVMNFPEVVKLSRDAALPDRIREGLKGYLDTLPGYVDAAFDDNGMEKPLGPDQPMVDTNVVKQQHGYLTMQFTRALQSLGNDYGYIFEAKNADIDMVDVVLNRRILVVLIPALEKSPDEAANLGKLVAATLKGMMGSTLGATVEGESNTVIENKPTRSNTPFITVFDEVGYYTTQGMGVMAAQARSLGFCLVYAAQDLAALEKRVKEEAKSITGNCNIKIFGKIEDPMGTQDFFDRTMGKALVSVVGGWTLGGTGESSTSSYYGNTSASVDFKQRATFDDLRGFKEGEAILAFGMVMNVVNLYYANPGTAKAMRVQRFVGLPKTDDFILKHVKDIGALRDRLMSPGWTAAKGGKLPLAPEIAAIAQSTRLNTGDPMHDGALAIVGVQALNGNLDQMAAPAGTAAAQDSTQASASTNPMDFFASRKKLDEVADKDGDDTEGKGKSGSSSGGGGKAPKTAENATDSANIQNVPQGKFDSMEAVEHKAKTGMTMMPENLSDEVKSILKSAADNLAAGLFGSPELQPGAAGGGGGKGLKLPNAPLNNTTPFKR
ncbi:MAG: type IV secretion system DNA-binding domain-containing protein [Rhodospirillales bacterium]|nr:type IV secretion system DNA-binding domain-containing protein [Alphaproteobacteria bacterium]MCB9986942.1 type IV secretion system DNA-binding domain-containing protein [Rhodospirillales bacterium]USO08283.1 MAG: type IV secretion system DNA-binding domain-containing protein [Rhodospirillales bacterium]